MTKAKFNYKRIILPNNLRLLLYPIPEVQSIYARVDIKNGSIFEDTKNNGISHFLEHWIHQGNKKYPKSSVFSTLLEEEGIFQNGITHPFGSYYFMKSPAIKLEKTIDFLFLMMAQPTFPKDRQEHVREIVINEYNDYWQKPESKFYYDLLAKRFTDRPSYLQEVLGTKKSIISIDQKAAVSWYEKFYKAGNFILTIAGNFDEKKLIHLVEKSFGKLPKSEEIKYPKMTRNHYSNSLLHLQKEDREQITFYITIPAFGWKQKSIRKSFVLSIITSIIGGGRFSRLFKLLREKNNLVYNISAGRSLDPQRGTISLHGLTANQNLTKTLELTYKEITKIKKEGVTKREVQIAKNIFESYNVFRMESPEGIAEHLINQEFWDEKILTPEKIIKEINKITLDEVNNLASEFLTFEKVNIGLFGNVEKDSLKQIESIYSI